MLTYLAHARSEDKKYRNGQIIYRTAQTEEFRKKVRNCLSFVLGLPIVYYGHTDYASDWSPTFMSAVDAFTIDGAMFKIHDEPPYPISNQKYSNMIDQKAVNDVLALLFSAYESIEFNQLSWVYWYGRCAPIHTSAVYFGGMIEQLQRLSRKTYNKIIELETWKKLEAELLGVVQQLNLDAQTKKILLGKISSLNQAPAGLSLKRSLEAMGLLIGVAESNAWRHRNAAAHGGMISNMTDVITNSQLLRVMFHRLLAGITYCSDSYIDYYSFEFPVRLLAQPVPERSRI